ncbi:3'-5' exonuclease [Pleurocapsa sp. FMAR1]|uniref:3'-5' exonuclease n=1 Tax=Pleurocapsa sp. FMAR1 TaxID=3040204 RepID=UPI0029C981DE|nr:exonuclease domain-containing protein [Pleurocapsa sp. FMAR1]
MTTQNTTLTKKDAILKSREILANPQKYVLIDVETTGLTAQDEILQLAILNLSGDTIFNAYFLPNTNISSYAYASNNLTIDTLLARGAKPYSDRADEIAEILEGKIVLYYATSHLDKILLNNTAVKYGYPEVVGESVDILRMRQVVEGTKQCPNGGNHNAVKDARVSLAHLKNIAKTPVPELMDVETLVALRSSLDEKKSDLTRQLKDIDNALKEHMLASGEQEITTMNGFNITRKLSITKTRLKENVQLCNIDTKYIQPATLKATAIKKAISDGVDVSWFADYIEDFTIGIKSTK